MVYVVTDHRDVFRELVAIQLPISCIITKIRTTNLKKGRHFDRSGEIY